MQILSEIISFWKETWQRSKLLFFVEAVCSLMGMTACSLLNFSPTNPNMMVILVLYGVSALGLSSASYVRRAPWVFVLMSFYTIVSCIGITKLLLN